MPPDNAVTVPQGVAVQFPNNGPVSGPISRLNSSDFILGAAGTYQVMFQVSVNEPGQLVLALNGIELAHTIVGRPTGTSPIVGMALVTAVANDVLNVRNALGSFVALTITPLAGGNSPVSAHLVITQLPVGATGCASGATGATGVTGPTGATGAASSEAPRPGR